MSMPFLHRHLSRGSDAFNQTLFESAAVGLAVLDGEGRVLNANRHLCAMLGYELDHLLRATCDELAHPEDGSCRELIGAVARGERHELSVERRYRQSNGGWRWVKLRVTTLEDNRCPGDARMVAVIEDINERKRYERALRESQRRLQLVEEHTAEALEASARIRTTERMSVIGTLSAGLGHDMANLLVPVHIRLDALSRMDLADDASDHVLAIKSSAHYMQKLSSALRLLAADASSAGGGGPTHLRTWANDTGGILRTVLPGSVALDVEMPDAWVTMTQPSLMQAVFNLVQNAGDVLRDRTDGRVSVHGEVDGDHINIMVTDNGPGMTEDVRRRCIEPFFTTRHRTISTGLGLSIVYGLVREVGGVVDVQSRFGHGTTFTLRLKRGVARQDKSVAPSRAALVQVGDARLRALVTMELQALHYDVAFDTAGKEPDMVVCDHWPLATATEGPVVLLADGPNTPASAIALGPKPAVQAIRHALREVAAV